MSQRRAKKARVEERQMVREILAEAGGIPIKSFHQFLTDILKRNPSLREQLIRRAEIHWTGTGAVLAIIGPTGAEGEKPVSFLFASSGVTRAAVDALAVELGIAEEGPPGGVLGGPSPPAV